MRNVLTAVILALPFTLSAKDKLIHKAEIADKRSVKEILEAGYDNFEAEEELVASQRDVDKEVDFIVFEKSKKNIIYRKKVFFVKKVKFKLPLSDEIDVQVYDSKKIEYSVFQQSDKVDPEAEYNAMKTKEASVGFFTSSGHSPRAGARVVRKESDTQMCLKIETVSNEKYPARYECYIKN